MIISDNENHGQLPPCGKKRETRVALLFLLISCGARPAESAVLGSKSLRFPDFHGMKTILPF